MNPNHHFQHPKVLQIHPNMEHMTSNKNSTHQISMQIQEPIKNHSVQKKIQRKQQIDQQIQLDPQLNKLNKITLLLEKLERQTQMAMKLYNIKCWRQIRPIRSRIIRQTEQIISKIQSKTPKLPKRGLKMLKFGHTKQIIKNSDFSDRLKKSDKQVCRNNGSKLIQDKRSLKKTISNRKRLRQLHFRNNIKNKDITLNNQDPICKKLNFDIDRL